MKIKERLNLYICEHGCHNVTVDVDKGVTPFMIKCVREADKDRPLDPIKSRDGVCIGTAKSCFYPKEIEDHYEYPVPKHEWYRPELSEYAKLSKHEKDHVRNGGLLLRKRTAKEPILHDDWDGSRDYKIPDYESALYLERRSKSQLGKRFF